MPLIPSSRDTTEVDALGADPRHVDTRESEPSNDRRSTWVATSSRASEHAVVEAHVAQVRHADVGVVELAGTEAHVAQRRLQRSMTGGATVDQRHPLRPAPPRSCTPRGRSARTRRRRVGPLEVGAGVPHAPSTRTPSRLVLVEFERGDRRHRAPSVESRTRLWEDAVGDGGGTVPFRRVRPHPFLREPLRHCDFSTWTDRAHLIDDYIDALLLDLARQHDSPRPRACSSAAALRRCSRRPVAARASTRSRADGAEVTVECNPDSADAAKLQQYAAGGVNRISLGVQSMAPHVLRALGRTHVPDNVGRDVAATRRAAGIGTDQPRPHLRHARRDRRRLGRHTRRHDCARPGSHQRLHAHRRARNPARPARRRGRATCARRRRPGHEVRAGRRRPRSGRVPLVRDLELGQAG